MLMKSKLINSEVCADKGIWTGQTEFSSGPLKFQGWLPDLRWRITAQQQFSSTLLIFNDASCRSVWDQQQEKGCAAFVYPTGDVGRALLQWATARSLPQRCYDWMKREIKYLLQLTRALWACSTETTNARSHRGNSYFLAFSLLCLEISRRYWTYPLCFVSTAKRLPKEGPVLSWL